MAELRERFEELLPLMTPARRRLLFMLALSSCTGRQAVSDSGGRETAVADEDEPCPTQDAVRSFVSTGRWIDYDPGYVVGCAIDIDGALHCPDWKSLPPPPGVFSAVAVERVDVRDLLPQWFEELLP